MLAGIASDSLYAPAGDGGTVDEALTAAIHESQNPVTERRRHPRLEAPFRARVRIQDACGWVITLEAEAKDVSASGLYVRLSEAVAPGTRLTAEIFVTGGPVADFAFEGEVVRAEALIDLRHGAAVRFDQMGL